MLKKLMKEKYTSLPIITQKSLIYSLFDGSFSLLHVTLVGSTLMVGFALYLGANPLHIAFLSSFPSLSQITQIFSAFIEQKHPKRKRIVAFLTIISRQVCWIMPFIVFIDSPSLKMSLFLLLYCFYAVASNMSINIWQSWMSDLVPANIWGLYFGFRTTIQNTVLIIGVFAVSYIYDLLQKQGLYHASFFVLYGCAGLSALAALYFLLKLHEPSYHPHEQYSLKEIFKTPFSDMRFRKILFFLGAWSFAVGLSMPFYSVHMIVYLKMSYSAIALFTVIATVMNLIAYPFWGKMIDETNSKSVLWHSIIAVTVLPWLWLSATPSFLIFIWLDAVLTGIYWPAINAGLFNLVLVGSLRQNRSAYLAVQASVSGVSTFFGAMVGGLIAQQIESLRFEFLGHIFINNHVFFALSGVLRGCSLVFLWNVKELPLEPASKFYRLLKDLGVKSARIIRDDLLLFIGKTRVFLKNSK
jgi:MFS family permease